MSRQEYCVRMASMDIASPLEVSLFMMVKFLQQVYALISLVEIKQLKQIFYTPISKPILLQSWMKLQEKYNLVLENQVVKIGIILFLKILIGMCIKTLVNTNMIS